MVVVGGGPGGVLLTYLLSRGGVAVTLLEARHDFARRFRGDTLAPGVLDYLDDLGTNPSYLHTDGQGIISKDLRDLIWSVLVEAWPDKKNLSLKPSAVSPDASLTIDPVHLTDITSSSKFASSVC